LTHRRRKAWLFSGKPKGAKAVAAMFTLSETVKVNGVEPYAYVQHVVGNIAATADTDEALDTLMPWNMSYGMVQTPDALICWRFRLF